MRISLQSAIQQRDVETVEEACIETSGIFLEAQPLKGDLAGKEKASLRKQFGKGMPHYDSTDYVILRLARNKILTSVEL